MQDERSRMITLGSFMVFLIRVSEDFDSDNIEVIETVTGSFNVYEKYGVRTVGLYDYETITSLSEYAGE